MAEIKTCALGLFHTPGACPVRGRPSFQSALAREHHALDMAGIVLPAGKL